MNATEIHDSRCTNSQLFTLSILITSAAETFFKSHFHEESLRREKKVRWQEKFKIDFNLSAAKKCIIN